MTPAEVWPAEAVHQTSARRDTEREERRERGEGEREGQGERERERHRLDDTSRTPPSRRASIRGRRRPPLSALPWRGLPCPASAPDSQARNPLVLVKASRAAKERIVGQVGLSSDAPIKSVLMQFEWSLIQHEFLRRERLAGRTLPRTQEEMEWMLRQRPTSRAFRMLRSESMRMQGRMRASKVARPRGFAAERGLRLVN